jgi:acyl-CoA reductase-like NAD-dependent aldehyde dehydrogenase
MDKISQRTVIDSVEELEKALKRIREAEKVFSQFPQEKVDRIFFAAAMAADKARIPLAKMAVEETGMGRCGRQGHQESFRLRVYLQQIQEHENLRRDRGRQGIRNREDRRTSRNHCSRHPDDQPHIHGYFQNAGSS